MNAVANAATSGELGAAIIEHAAALDSTSPLRGVALSATLPPTPVPTLTPTAATLSPILIVLIIAALLSICVAACATFAARRRCARANNAKVHAAPVHQAAAPPAPVVPAPIQLVPTGVVRQSIITIQRDSTGQEILQEQSVAAGSANGRPPAPAALLPQGSILRTSS